MTDWCESNGYTHGVVDGWPGEYWLKQVQNIPVIKLKKENGKVITIKDQVEELYIEYSNQCIESHYLMEMTQNRNIKIKGLDRVLSNAAGTNRAKCYRLQQAVGLHKNTFSK